MENYISQGRRGYLEMLNTLKHNSDIIVDGTLSVSEIGDKIYEIILSQSGRLHRVQRYCTTKALYE